MAAGHAHHQAGAGAGIAEIEHARGLAQAADADPVDAPAPGPVAVDRRAERPAGLGGVAARPRLRAGPRSAVSPMASSAEDHGPVRNRLVAGNAHAPLERRPGAAGGERSWLGCDTAGILWDSRGPLACAGREASSRHPPSGSHGQGHLSQGLAIDRAGATNGSASLFSHRRRNPDRGETGTRHEAPVRELRREVLRPEQGPDRLPEMRHEFLHGGGALTARASRAPAARPVAARRGRGRWAGDRRRRARLARDAEAEAQGKKRREAADRAEDDIEVDGRASTTTPSSRNEEEADDDVTDIIGERGGRRRALRRDVRGADRRRRLIRVMPNAAGSRHRGTRWGHSSVGRALEWHSRGRRFDSPWLHQLRELGQYC